MDPHSFSLLDPDPHPGKIEKSNRKNAKKLVRVLEYCNNFNFIKNVKVNLVQLHGFLLLSNLVCKGFKAGSGTALKIAARFGSAG